ncbi:hypothetical protein NC981_01440 [Leptolyngbya sp. DQ-M1]
MLERLSNIHQSEDVRALLRSLLSTAVFPLLKKGKAIEIIPNLQLLIHAQAGTDFAILASSLNASLTEAESRKTSATSGSRTTTLLDFLNAS